MKPFKYITADDSSRPGYLRDRMKQYRKEAELKAIREKAGLAKVENLADRKRHG